MKDKNVVNLEEFKKKQENLKQLYKDYVTSFDSFNETFVVTFDKKVELNKSEFLKFQRAASKGFVRSKQNDSGIKLLLSSVYEIKVMSLEERLISDK